MSRRHPAAMSRARRVAAIGVALAVLGGCSPAARTGPPTPPPAESAVRFEDATTTSGIRFRHHSGAVGKRYMPETMGAGVALVDLDNDGRLDILLVDSTRWPGGSGERGQSRLFRNLGEGKFQDVTREWGLPGDLYGMGAAAGDYDNDGFTDVFLTALSLGNGGSRLLRNVAGRKFQDVTATSGIRTPGWPTSAAWLDYNRDGRLDLFVCHYVNWTPQTDQFFALDGVNKTYARPDLYPGTTCQLFENRGGRFVDVSARAGINVPDAKSLGVALLDFDADGWVDIAVSNDTVRNFLFHNQGNGTFKEVAVQAGVAVAEAGIAKAGMGIDAADYDNSGQPAILITNFTGEQLSLYRRDPSGLFMDVAARNGIGAASQRYLGFGAFFFDADLDSWPDILVANGHIQHDIAVRSSGVTYAQSALLFRGSPSGQFHDVSATSGALATPRVSRGAAYGDLDGDGDLDVVLCVNDGSPVILRQAGPPRSHWLALHLEGRTGNRSAIGATVRLRAGGRTQTRMVRSGSSYLSQSALTLTFGLGETSVVDDIEIRWPNGGVESFDAPGLDRELRLVEGTGG